MSSKRAPSAPPDIPGYTFHRFIGSGGFADVFLYSSQRARRQVAVKVLLADWVNDAQREAFDAEADLMATLGNHPSVVTMVETGAAPDGRPYLAMEYCSRPHLGARYRSERFSLAEAVRTTIQIAGAVETAHRMGILHRDIKPANILVTQFGHPVLTDFGIASTLDAVGTAEGMSIPWSPPESFADPPSSGVATDVWALGATCYTLLAGRTPFEVPGGPNGSADLVSRIVKEPLRPTGRSDVPPSLERVLQIAMAKQPGSRFPSALAFARSLQQVQAELARDVTPIDILDESGAVHEEDQPGPGTDVDPDSTRMSRVTAVDPGQSAVSGASAAASPAPVPMIPDPPMIPGDGGAGSGSAASPARTSAPGTSPPGTSPPEHHREPGFVPSVPTAGQWSGPPVDETVYRLEATPEPAEEPVADTPPRNITKIIVIDTLLLVVVGALIWWGVTALRPGPDAEPTAEPTGSGAVDVAGGYVPPVRDLVAEIDGDDLLVSWSEPREIESGDEYGWRVVDLTAASAPFNRTGDTEVLVPLGDGQQTCVDVVVVRGSSTSQVQQRVCSDEAEDRAEGADGGSGADGADGDESAGAGAVG